MSKAKTPFKKLRPSRVTKTFITTIEGKKYELPKDQEKFKNEVNPITIKVGFCGYEDTDHRAAENRFYVLEKTLIESGLLGPEGRRRPNIPQETVEDILLRLLEQIGVYPQQ